MSQFQHENTHVKHKKIGTEIHFSTQSICIGGWFVFVLLWCLPKTPVSAIPPALFLITLFSDWPGSKQLFRQYRIEIGMILAALVLGILLSAIPEKSVKGTYDFLRGGVIFFPTILLARARPDLFRTFLPWALGLACLVFAGGTLEVILRAGDDLAGPRYLFETYFGNSNHFGAGASMVALLALGSLWVFPGRWPMRICLLLIASVCLGLTLYSGSRGSVLAFIVAAIYLAYARLRQWRWLILLAGGVLVFGFLWLLSVDFFQGFGGSWSRGGDFSAGRFGLYAATLSETWRESKFFGFGANTFKYLNVGQVLPTQMIMPHSLFIELFFSLGLVGSALFLSAFVWLGLRLFRGRGERSPLAVVGGCILMFVLARGAIDLKLWSVYVPGLIACGLGLLLASSPLENLPTEE